MFDLSAPELLVILVIVVLLFGPGRLSKVMSEIGKGMRAFKESATATEDTSSAPSDKEISSK